MTRDLFFPTPQIDIKVYDVDYVESKFTGFIKLENHLEPLQAHRKRVHFKLSYRSWRVQSDDLEFVG